PRLVIERDDLELRARRDLRGEPVDRVHGLLPLRRSKLSLARHVAPADDVDERPVEHAHRRVDEDQHAPAAHAETRQVLSIALTGDAADTVAGLCRRHARRGLPLDLRSERRERGLELLDRLATREAFLGHPPEILLRLLDLAREPPLQPVEHSALLELRCELLSRLNEILASREDRKSTRLNSSHVKISYAVFCLK